MIIDKMLLCIKHPKDYSRKQRSIMYWKLYNANEYKNLLFNASIYIFKDIMAPEYYKHFCKYILFIRILTNEKILPENILYADQLINEFISEFEILYGEDELTYNLHAHLHLALQVLNYGPLDKVSCFPFGVKICADLYYGTRGIGEQIIRNLTIRQNLKFIFLSNFKFSKPELNHLIDSIQQK